ncbi:MAG: hypothetical protein AAF541_03730 [Pseudomonadota bacterium]
MLAGTTNDQSNAKLTWLCLFLSGLLSSNPAAYAAVQGNLGSSTTATTDLTYTQGLSARISGFSDMNLGTYSGTGSMTATDNICIGRSGVGFFGSGAYRVRAAGDGTPGNPSAFTLSNGSEQMFYNVFFNDQTGLIGRAPMTAGVALTGQSGGGFAFVFNLVFGCVFNNANLSIEVPEAELQRNIGTFSGTLSLTLIPE